MPYSFKEYVIALKMSCAIVLDEIDSVHGISTNMVRRARNIWVRSLCGDALITTLLFLWFALLDKHKSPGTSTVFELMTSLDKEAIICFKIIYLFPWHVYCTFISDKKWRNNHGVAGLQINVVLWLWHGELKIWRLSHSCAW